MVLVGWCFAYLGTQYASSVGKQELFTHGAVYFSDHGKTLGKPSQPIFNLHNTSLDRNLYASPSVKEMSCATHQREIDKDDSRLRLDALVLSFSGLRCPFCGDTDLFIHAPGTRYLLGARTWWTVGCDSHKCNSCWTLNGDTYEQVMGKIQYANAQANPPA